MNIFKITKDYIIEVLNDASEKKIISIPKKLDSISVDPAPEKFDCDLSTNVAMILSKLNNKSPLDLAEIIKSLLIQNQSINDIKIVKPGFINITFNNKYWNDFLKKAISQKYSYGSDSENIKKKYLIEFVSANPTGPLHVGHCRGAIIGDVLSNLLKFNKHNVDKEYYVNDHGNQIHYFVKSIYLRIEEIRNKKPFPSDDPDLYPGDYLIEIANQIIQKNNDLNFENYDEIKDKLMKLSVFESLQIIKKNLQNLGIQHDNFASESDIVNNNEVEKVVKKLSEDNFVFKGKIKAPEGNKNSNYVEREQLLFKSTAFGDDKDRALQKSDNSWTYFATDVAYHNTKINRKYNVLINILGADHSGYIKRITSVVEALSNKKVPLICKVSQLVKLIKDGKPFKMSKRKGNYITVEDLLNEVGKDATRFIMLSRSNDMELDFDFTNVKEKSKENPLYYVQYCYARISSVFRNLNKSIEDEISITEGNYEYKKDELKILRKITEWPNCVLISATKLEPHRIPTYLFELSSLFHSYWNMGRDDKSKRFINEDKKISKEKLALLKIVSNTIKTGMNILGVDTPHKM